MSVAGDDPANPIGRPLAAFLATRGLGDAEPLWALRLTLDPRDRCPEHPSLAALVAQGHDRAYSRMSEGLRLGSGRAILVFAGIAFWAWRPKNRRRFEKDARIPLNDE